MGSTLCIAACELASAGALPTDSAELYRDVFRQPQAALAELEFGVADSGSPHDSTTNHAVAELHREMQHERATGRAVVTQWKDDNVWDVEPLEFVKTVCRVKAWTTFVAPLLVGGIVGGADDATLAALRRFAVLLGVASHVADETRRDRDLCGRTLAIAHAVRSAEPGLREELVAELAQEQPKTDLLATAMQVAGSHAFRRAFVRRLATQARAALAAAYDGPLETDSYLRLDGLAVALLER